MTIWWYAQNIENFKEYKIIGLKRFETIYVTDVGKKNRKRDTEPETSREQIEEWTNLFKI